MEIWELNQLTRSEIEKMRDDIKRTSAALDTARRNITEDTVSFLYPNAELWLYFSNTLLYYSGDDLRPENLSDHLVFYLWLCFSSLVERDIYSGNRKCREERMSLAGNLIIRASFLRKTRVLERISEYSDLLLVEVDIRGFYNSLR